MHPSNVSALPKCVHANHIVKARLWDTSHTRVLCDERWRPPPAQNNVTPLYMAAQFGHLEMVRQLVDKGADMEAGNKVRHSGMPQSQADTYGCRGPTK